ncbi:MAG TPA: amidase [Gemmatimonadaceae bacterium]|nr:amidase [Gemmatimonadaceae bacterium]
MSESLTAVATVHLPTGIAMTTSTALPDRRAFLGYFSSIGLGSTLLPGVLWAKVADGADITKETIACAEEIAGISFTDDERAMMVRNLTQQKQSIDALHKTTLENSVAPALVFDPMPPGVALTPRRKIAAVRARVPLMARPGVIDDLAFLPVTQLAELVRGRKVKPSELTEMYLGRLKRFDPQLHCVISLTEERARAQAKAADAEIARGQYRGPLHGIPWGAKDLLAAKGYRTTWGAGPYKEQVIDEDAVVVQRLDRAGAILVAKLTLGELAQGDVWFGGVTRNPWWTEQGSSGSSAGPASATAAGLVGFSIGTETLGSISSPSTRCGVTGLRPTFGRVPRTGAMALAWSMDKIGPICRSVEDCALVLDAIYGPDGQDLAVRDYPFNWNATVRPSALRIGYVKAAFDQPEHDPANPDRLLHATKVQDDAALAVLERLGARLVPIELPQFPVGSGLILQPEAGAAFETLLLTGKIKEMVQQTPFAWPNTFRSAQFVPAVEYINANRARQLLMRQWWDLFKDLDVVVSPTFGTQLQQTNLTGNPAVIVPNGFREAPPLGPGTSATPVAPPRPDSSRAAADTGRREQPPVPSPRPQTPVSLTFLGPLYHEEKPLALAHAYQQATDFHRRTPPGF